jgi:TRAP transporter TAXI family solute receptor
MFAAIPSIVTVTALTSSVPPAMAVEFGTREEAVTMVKRVQKMFKTAGPEATFEAIRRKQKEFYDRDLYAYVIDLNGVVHANGAVPAVQGKSIIDFRDQNGKYLVREEVEICKNPGYGWLDFRWLSPLTKVVEDKSAYLERLGNTEYCTGVGVYKNEQVNENTVAIISGSPNSGDTYLQIAYDLAAVLSDADTLRILPMIGIGGSQNIRDVRFLRGIDIGLTQTSILNNFQRANAQLGNHDYDGKIVYIAKLFNEEAHVVARSGITSLEQLQGRKVSLDVNGSGTNTSMRDIFKRLGIKVDEVNVTQGDAMEKLRNGEIDAAVLIAGKPTRSMQNLKPGVGLHFLPIPFTAALGADYLPATLTHDDYPNMMRPGESVETIAVGAVLIAYNWPKNTDRYRRVEKFVAAFFPRIADFQKPPRHVKWQEVNLAATLPGWNRFEPAQAWLNANTTSAATATAGDMRLQSDQFLPAPTVQPAGVAQQDENKLFQEFMRWKRSRGN